jgi:hypothetical protein
MAVADGAGGQRHPPLAAIASRRLMTLFSPSRCFAAGFLGGLDSLDGPPGAMLSVEASE